MSSPEAHPPEEASFKPTLEALRKRNSELAEAVAARDTFIAVAAHELRNPMTPMIGQIDLLLSGVRAGKYAPDQIEQRLERIRQVMSHYIKRAAILLNVSRITSGRLALEHGACDLAALVRTVVETYAAAALHAGSPIEVDAPASLSGTWDRLAMEQIVDNLVSNAIKYGGRGPVRVCAEALGDTISLQVRDFGPGIAMKDRSRIFQRFERAVGAEESRSGFGIGLWVVRQLIEAMKGTITVDDARGGGSVFTVILPRHVEANRP
ncbi:sensor histidine kinase [Rhodopila sp.]|uniref:sensor histidine kinase n=1 Tax=Rhodopila sp. TaxID=2480087 RepID=UPI003D14F629